MAVSENVIRFFKLYEESEELKARIENDVDMYPGSLEIRESLVEDVLLPVAREMGCPFTVEELRAYESKKLLADRSTEPGGSEQGECSYWLLNRGWENNEAVFCSHEQTDRINIDKLFGI